MSHPTDPPAAGDWRRLGSSVFIVAWLALQIGLPVFQKFELPDGRYRTTRFAWAMYGRAPVSYEVSLFRTRGGDERQAIPDLSRFVYGYQSPEPMTRVLARESEAEMLERHAALIRFIAEQQADEYEYVVSIRRTGDQSTAQEWEYRR